MQAIVGLKSTEDHLKGFKQGSGQDDICIFKGSLAADDTWIGEWEE